MVRGWQRGPVADGVGYARFPCPFTPIPGDFPFPGIARGTFRFSADIFPNLFGVYRAMGLNTMATFTSAGPVRILRHGICRRGQMWADVQAAGDSE